MRAALVELLTSADPEARAQGRELALSLPAETAAALQERFSVINGWLDSPDPPAAVLVSILLELPGLDALRRATTHLQLAGPGVQALLPQLVAAMPHLESLDLSYSDVTDLRPLAALPGLRALRADNSDLRNLDGMERLSLRALSLRWCKLEHTAPVHSQPELEVFRIGQRHAPLFDINLDVFPQLHTAELHQTIPSSMPPGLRTLIAPTTASADLPDSVWSLPLETLVLDRLKPGVPIPTLRYLQTRARLRWPLPDWPLRRAHAESRENLSLNDPTLQWLDAPYHRAPKEGEPDELEGPLLADLRDRKAPLVLDFEPSGRPWPAPLLAAPAVLRRALPPGDCELDAEVMERSARHWHTNGYRWQLQQAQPGPYHRIRMIKGLRSRLELGLRRAKVLDDHSQTVGYRCLSWDEARAIQALGLYAGRWLIRSPWDPKPR